MNPKTERERFAQPEDFSSAACVLRDCFLGDYSPSMDSEGFERHSTKKSLMYEAVKACLDIKRATRPDDYVALAGFHHNGVVISPFVNVEEEYAQFATALERSRSVSGNDTRLDRGLHVARDLVRQGDRRLRYADVPVFTRILAYSDGYSGGAEAAVACAEELKAQGVVIETFGIGKNPREVDEKLLRRVASTIKGVTHYRFLGDGAEIRKTFEQLAQGMLTI